MTKLFGVTGHDSLAALRAETERIVAYLRTVEGLMDQRDLSYLASIESEMLASGTWVPTTKQLFRLRDMKDLY